MVHHRNVARLRAHLGRGRARAGGPGRRHRPRRPQPLAHDHDETALLTLDLDVTERAQVQHAVRQAAEHFGRLDVVVNNAGARQYGTVEELTEQEIRTQMETNFFGALWVGQATLPIL